MLPAEDKLSMVANNLKWNMVTVFALLATLYLLRSAVLEARDELEAARVRAARAENDLDGALATIQDIKTRHGIGDEPGDE